jgi:carbon starvation protein
VVRNTAVQGSLSIAFLVLTLIVIVAAILVTIKNVRTHRADTTEDPEIPSKIYEPAGLIPTPAEKALAKEWEDYEAGQAPAGSEKAGA